MARERMVTRTIESKKANCWILNTETGTTREGEFLAPAALKTDTKILDYLNLTQKENLLPDEKITVVKFCTVEKTRYGMPESEFISHAVMLDNDYEEGEE